MIKSFHKFYSQTHVYFVKIKDDFFAVWFSRFFYILRMIRDTCQCKRNLVCFVISEKHLRQRKRFQIIELCKICEKLVQNCTFRNRRGKNVRKSKVIKKVN